MRRVEVTCYSGLEYVGRPISFAWEGAELHVEQVAREWREPGEKCFRVRVAGDRTFELRYNEQHDLWSAEEIRGVP